MVQLLPRFRFCRLYRASARSWSLTGAHAYGFSATTPRSDRNIKLDYFAVANHARFQFAEGWRRNVITEKNPKTLPRKCCCRICSRKKAGKLVLSWFKRHVYRNIYIIYLTSWKIKSLIWYICNSRTIWRMTLLGLRGFSRTPDMSSVRSGSTVVLHMVWIYMYLFVKYIIYLNNNIDRRFLILFFSVFLRFSVLIIFLRYTTFKEIIVLIFKLLKQESRIKV